MINGWQLLEPARRRGSRFVRAVVRFGDHAHEIDIGRLEVVLSSQIYQDDFTLADPERENGKFDFAVWDAAGRMWYRGIRDGLVELRSMPSTPLAWLASQPRGALSQFDEIDIERARYESMPDDVAAAVEHRLRQLADAPGGRIVLDVGDLTEAELEMIADSEIPPELRWNSTEEPQRNQAWSDDEYDARRQLHDNGGRMSVDVASLPIEDVRRLNAMREIDDLLRAMSLEQLERARDAVRAVEKVDDE